MNLAESPKKVGRGWQLIVDELHWRLTDLVGDYDVTQMRYKEGMMIVHIVPRGDFSGEVIEMALGAIEEARLRSLVTCEWCGQSGTQVTVTGSKKPRTFCSSCLEKANRPARP